MLGRLEDGVNMVLAEESDNPALAQRKEHDTDSNMRLARNSDAYIEK